jgi:formylglycine-generating enzyme required for sulfatase activity
MGSNPPIHPDYLFPLDDDLPVTNINFYDAIEYLNARSIAEGLTPAYTLDKTQIDPDNNNLAWGQFGNDPRYLVVWHRNANGYRLPTDAEWEYAARAGTTTPLPVAPGSFNSNNHANFNGMHTIPPSVNRQTTTPKGTFPPNTWGLYDVLGNGREWVWDWTRIYNGTSVIDPIGTVKLPGQLCQGRTMRSSSFSTTFYSMAFGMRGTCVQPHAPFAGIRMVRNVD